MKCWIVSDTHALHNELKIPKDIDTIIHCGDSTNYKDWLRNEQEFRPFLEWFNNLEIKNKILIAGNHK